MSQNIRATARSRGRYGRIAKVLGSGTATTSDSSMALKPVIEDPSKPIPCSSALRTSSRVMEKLLSRPRMSVNQRRMNRTSRSSTAVTTSSLVTGAPSGPGRSGCRDRLPEPERPRPRRETDGDGATSVVRAAWRAGGLPDEEHLRVLRQRPEVVGHRALQRVADPADLVHRGQHLVAHVDRLGHEVVRVIEVDLLQRLDRLRERVDLAR